MGIRLKERIFFRKHLIKRASCIITAAAVALCAAALPSGTDSPGFAVRGASAGYVELSDRDIAINSLRNAGMTGNGTETDPFLISTPAQLGHLSSVVAYRYNCLGLYFKLRNDPDMSGINFIPIGTHDSDGSYSSERYAFSGHFDGGGFR